MATLAEARKMTSLPFTRIAHPSPVEPAARAAALADPGFCKLFSDHMITIEWSAAQGWHSPKLGPRGPLTLDHTIEEQPTTQVQPLYPPSALSATITTSVFR